MRRCDGFNPSRTSGKSAADDHAHGVRQVALLQFVFDRKLAKALPAAGAAVESLPACRILRILRFISVGSQKKFLPATRPHQRRRGEPAGSIEANTSGACNWRRGRRALLLTRLTKEALILAFSAPADKRQASASGLRNHLPKHDLQRGAESPPRPKWVALREAVANGAAPRHGRWIGPLRQRAASSSMQPSSCKMAVAL